MAVDGVWGFTYVGEVGVGCGVFIVKDGRFHGADTGGVDMEGTIVEDETTGELSISCLFKVPAGSFQVGGGSPMEVDSSHHRDFKLPRRFDELKPIDITFYPGKTLAIFKQIPDENAWLADGVVISPRKRK
jgi:hypothetical protein